ncbi:MAG: hypothetical protein EPO24_01140 [Bacteroidetes bacterium]|nr:MAG: hypothetical protein EPO24_01140 [Bacteroidota bacterium]
MKKETLYSIIALLFITSGAIGLVYEIVWFKYLSLFLGNTTYAQSIVLASFMVGLAIGATLWGNRADYVEKPLIIYAILEILIGVYCLLYPFFFEFLKSTFINVVLSLDLPSDGTSVLALKLITSVITLLPPTILMGGTLPVLVRHISERIEESGKNIAILYFLNSFGAVVGSFLGGFFFVRILGLDPTIYLAATLNITIGIVALLLTKIKTEHHEIVEEAVEGKSPKQFSRKEITIAFVVAGISGLCSMMYEVGWVRLLIPVLGSSTYSFSIMLVTFISGITIGSWLVSKRIDTLKNMFGFLAICQFGVVVSLLATLPLYGYLPYAFWHTSHILTRSGTTYPLFLAIQLLFTVAIMIVPTIFLGMSLPVASRIAANNLSFLGKSVGNIFSVNTLGTVVGSLGAGLMFIPLIGIRHTIELALVLNLLLGIVVLMSDTLYATMKKYLSLGFITLAVVGYFIISPDWSHVITLSGVFRNINDNSPPPQSYDEFLRRSIPPEILYYKEGTTASVAVVVSQSQAYWKQKVLLINGKADASSKGDMPTQVLLAQFPSMLHPKPESALVIGLGSGATVGSILSHPVKHLDCVEISPEVVEAEQFFREVNHHPLEDPRTTLFVEDALAFLNLTKHNYDIIVSEPSNPWIAGIGNLYTIEFFELCKQHLRQDGMMVQWFHLYEMDDETLRLVFNTFQTVFPNVTVWQSFSTDVILIGSVEPIKPNFQAMKKKFELSRVNSDLANISITNLPALLSLQIVSKYSVAEYTGYCDVNTEKLPYLEYWAPRSFFINAGVNEFSRFDERGSLLHSNVLLKSYIAQHGLSDSERLDIAKLHTLSNRGSMAMGYAFLRDYVDEHPEDVTALELLADAADQLGRKEESFSIAASILAKNPDDPGANEKYGWLYFLNQKPVTSSFTKNRLVISEQALLKSISLVNDTVDRYRSKLGDIYFGMGDYQKAMENYRKVLQIRQQYPSDPALRMDLLLFHLAKAAHLLGKDDVALGYIIQSFSLNPNNQEMKELGYNIFMKAAQKNKSKAK